MKSVKSVNQPHTECKNCAKRITGVTTGFECFTPMYALGNAREKSEFKNHLIATPINHPLGHALNNKGTTAIRREGRKYDRGFICGKYTKRKLRITEQISKWRAVFVDKKNTKYVPAIGGLKW